MDVSATAAVAGVSIALLGQVAAFTFWLGKLSQRQTSDKEIVNIKFNNNKNEHNDILKASEKNTKILESVQDCIHKMQSGKDCD